MSKFFFSDETLRRLHNYAPTYEDPNVTVIRLLDRLESSDQSSAPTPRVIDARELGVDTTPIRIFEGDAVVDLRHSKILTAQVDHRSLPAPGWNKLVTKLCQMAVKSKGLAWLVEQKTPVVVPAERTDKGYKYYPQYGMSIQGMDSNYAWRNTLALARQLDVPIEVNFQWYDKEEATYPGQKGRLLYRPADR